MSPMATNYKKDTIMEFNLESGLLGLSSILLVTVGCFTKRLVGKVDKLEETSVSQTAVHQDRVHLDSSINAIGKKIAVGLRDMHDRMDRHIDSHTDNCPKSKDWDGSYDRRKQKRAQG